jgi:hypothetical protein
MGQGMSVAAGPSKQHDDYYESLTKDNTEGRGVSVCIFKFILPMPVADILFTLTLVSYGRRRWLQGLAIYTTIMTEVTRGDSIHILCINRYECKCMICMDSGHVSRRSCTYSDTSATKCGNTHAGGYCTLPCFHHPPRPPCACAYAASASYSPRHCTNKAGKPT